MKALHTGDGLVAHVNGVDMSVPLAPHLLDEHPLDLLELALGPLRHGAGLDAHMRHAIVEPWPR